MKRYEDTVQIHVAAGFDELTEPAHLGTCECVRSEDLVRRYGSRRALQVGDGSLPEGDAQLGRQLSRYILSVALNPAELIGKYRDFELNLNSYGRRFGFDIIYQDAKNFTGWYQHDGMDRVELTDGKLSMKTLNLNAFYVFNSRRFSYPAAF